MPLEIPCPQCGKIPPPPCACPPLPPGPADPPPAPEPEAKRPRYADPIKMRREKRTGREVIVLEGFPKGGFDLKAFAKELKRRCGTGGTVKGFAIEIQGDHRDTLAKVLDEHGFKSKRAGG